MSLKQLRSLDVLLVVLALFIAQAVVVISARDTANIEAAIGNFLVQVNGQQNVPKYTISDTSSSEQHYSLQLSQIYECDGGFNLSSCQKVPGSTVSLSALNWVFSSPEDQEDGSVTFQISSVPDADTFSTLVLDNQVFSTFDTTLNATVSEVKFDLTINDYKWVSADESALLVVKFNFQNNGNDNVYFSTVNQAIDASERPIVVELDTESGSPLLVFQHFDTKVVLDPSFGMKHADGSSAYFVTPSLFAIGLLLFALL